MKKIILLSCLLLSSVTQADQSGRANLDVEDGESYLKSLKSTAIANEAHEDESPETEWEKGLQSTAFAYGVQAGTYWQSKNVAAYLTVKQKMFDAGFNFEPLLIKYPKYSIAPAVISEDEGRLRTSESGQTLRILGKTYIINVKPRFVFNPLNWRQYLYISSSKPIKPLSEALPKNEKEQRIWDAAIEKGWGVGVKSVNYTIRVRFARLTRDYIGMTRYHLLRSHNMVSEPIINEKYKAVSGGGRVLNIEDSLITIEQTPSMNMTREQWKALPQLPDVSYLFPAGINDDLPPLNELIGYAGHGQPNYKYSEFSSVNKNVPSE